MKYLDIQRGVCYTQAWGTFLCLHIGCTVIHILPGRKRGRMRRLELFTPDHAFRWSSVKITGAKQ